YAIAPLYKLHNMKPPTLRLPDQVNLLSVAGPQGSGVQVDLDRDRWVVENMRRAGAARRKAPNQVRVTGVLLRERHLELINDTLRVLEIRKENVPAGLLGYFESGEDGILYIPSLAKIQQFKNYVKDSHGGEVVLENNVGGSLTTVTDGDLMPILAIGQEQA